MPIYSADLTPPHAVSFLWAAPALPAAAAAILALGGRALERRFGRGAVAGVTVAALGASAGIVVAAVFGVLFAAPPGGRILVDAAGALADVGGVLIAAMLTLDRRVAGPALAIALAGVAAAVAYAGASAKQPATDLVARSRALAAAVAGGLLLVLAESLPVVLVGWEALVLGSLAMVTPSGAPDDAESTRDRARALVASRVGQTAWLGGMVLLLWGLTLPGTAGPTPVRVDVQGSTGAGIEMPTLGDRPTAAALRRIPVGATLTFGEIATQLALRDTAERRPFQEALAARRLGPLPLLPFVYVGWLLGLALLGVAVLVGRPTLCVAVAMLAAAAALVARSWAVLVLSPAALVGAALAGAGVLVAWLRAVRTGRSLASTILGRAARELGVLPVRDFARGAAWLERRFWRPLAGVVVLGAGIVALVLLFV